MQFHTWVANGIMAAITIQEIGVLFLIIIIEIGITFPMLEA
ncbi:hypothetical protein HMPREF1109_1038 [Streptococcus intermedius SK54 = ATCC 27335]|nr:hypothetical protein HMPREF1109_1038 [Streptococcus intermedius SK54 = ATCC 27335]